MRSQMMKNRGDWKSLCRTSSEIQTASYKKYVGEISEVMVEGKNEARKQWMGRTSQNKTLNFTSPDHQSRDRMLRHSKCNP